jgi:hypothetical protein
VGLCNASGKKAARLIGPIQQTILFSMVLIINKKGFELKKIFLQLGGLESR